MSSPMPASSDDRSTNGPLGSPLSSLPVSSSAAGGAQRMPREDAIPILTDEVDVFWEFEDRDTLHDPNVKPLPRPPRRGKHSRGSDHGRA